jgi:hypothetical protein
MTTPGVGSHYSSPGKKSEQVPNETNWKRQLIEHDIRLQTVKMQMMELQF